jgi:hypothetical protein
VKNQKSSRSRCHVTLHRLISCSAEARKCSSVAQQTNGPASGGSPSRSASDGAHMRNGRRPSISISTTRLRDSLCSSPDKPGAYSLSRRVALCMRKFVCAHGDAVAFQWVGVSARWRFIDTYSVSESNTVWVLPTGIKEERDREHR